MKFRTRSFTSLWLTCLFTVAAFSGVVLYLTPRGRVANWSGWTLMGLDKHSWSAIHINGCLFFLIIALLHLFFNWKIFWSYIKSRASGLNMKTEMIVALLATAIVVAGTLYQVPPLSNVLAWNEQIKDYWEGRTPSGPAPHAEEFTLDRFASTVGLNAADITTALEQEGYEVTEEAMSIGSIADKNGITPNLVFAAIRKHYPDAQIGGGGGQGMGRGQGRRRGQARGMNSEGNGDHPGEGTGCSNGRSEGSSEGNAEHPEHEPDGEHGWGGPGSGRGMGMGMGRGMGAGTGRGMGAGMGRGMGRADEHPKPLQPESQPE